MELLIELLEKWKREVTPSTVKALADTIFLSQEEIGGSRKPTIFVSSSKVLSLSEIGTCQTCVNSSPITIEIPSDSSVPFPVGTEIEITQDETGTVTLTSGLGVAIKRQGSAATTGHVLVGRYSICVVKKLGINDWRAYGGLAW